MSFHFNIQLIQILITAYLDWQLLPSSFHFTLLQESFSYSKIQKLSITYPLLIIHEVQTKPWEKFKMLQWKKGAKWGQIGEQIVII